MKKLLSALLCVVFLNANVFAISGGPTFDDNNNVNIIGTYSGVLTPRDPEGSATRGPGDSSVNALGLFVLGVPEAGPATGSFVIFQEGLIFSGTITAVGDPGNGTIAGLVQADYDYSIPATDANGNIITNPTTGAITTIDVSASVTGTLKAKVRDSAGFDPTSISSLLSNVQRLKGVAEMAVSLGSIDAEGRPVITRIDVYDVEGVKQSTTVVGGNLDDGTGTAG